MIYLPELYYFFDQKDFPFEKAVLVTAKKVSEWCEYYKAQPVSTLKGVETAMRQGKLPAETEERYRLIESLVRWFSADSIDQNLYALFLDDAEIGKEKDRVAKFDHHDDTCCWVLNLTENEFAELQNVWKTNGLPTDLFYPEGKGMRVVIPNNPKDSFPDNPDITLMETSKIYTPKQWEEERQKTS